jgi:DNA-binding transcriptional MerR regulator
MTSSTMEREETAVRDLFARVDEVLDVAHSIEVERPRDAARLVHASHGALSAAEPVRVPVAAKILLVSDKTIRAWAEDGLLTPREVRPRLLIDAERLHTVLHFLSDLRAAGQDRDFREMLWNRLQDEALLDRTEMAESLSQMNAGNVLPALTSGEERQERRGRLLAAIRTCGPAEPPQGKRTKPPCCEAGDGKPPTPDDALLANLVDRARQLSGAAKRRTRRSAR